MRGETLMSHQDKSISKLTKILVFYAVQFWLYLRLFRMYMWERTFFYEIIVFELGTMLFYLFLNGFKYLVNYIEFICMENLSSRKSRLFLFSDLCIHLCKIVFQMLCLVRFTFYYNYPVFWARDIFLSVMISVEYVKKFFNSLKMVEVIDSLPVQSLANKNEDCGICLQRMTEGTQLPCKHFFHRDCLV